MEMKGNNKHTASVGVLLFSVTNSEEKTRNDIAENSSSDQDGFVEQPHFSFVSHAKLHVFLSESDCVPFTVPLE